MELHGSLNKKELTRYNMTSARALWSQALLLVLAFLLASSMTGCTQEEETLLSAAELSEASFAVEELMEAVKEGEKAVISPLLESAFFFSEDFGISEGEFIDGFFEGFDYRITDAKAIDEASATISLELKTRNGERVVNLLGNAYQEIFATGALSPDFAPVWSETYPTDFIDPYLVVVIKDGEEWAISEKPALAAALLGGFDPRQMYDE